MGEILSGSWLSFVVDDILVSALYSSGFLILKFTI